MEGGVREWLAGLTRRELVLLGVLGVGALGGAGLWYVRSLPQPVAVRAETAPVAAPSPSPASIFVHVAGWVRNPGVYELQEGARVIDAITLAGGPRRDADLGSLNLAALLADGQQVVVARALKGPVAPAAPAAGSPGLAADGTGLINVNTATAAELEELPGIGPVLAQAIIDHREQHGPFTSVDQLEDVRGIGPVTLGDIRDKVTV